MKEIQKPKVTNKVFRMLTEYYGTDENGISQLALCLNTDLQAVSSKIERMSTKEPPPKTQKLNKNEKRKVQKLMEKIPCHHCVWGNRIDENTIYCMFGRCIMGELGREMEARSHVGRV